MKINFLIFLFIFLFDKTNPKINKKQEEHTKVKLTQHNQNGQSKHRKLSFFSFTSGLAKGLQNFGASLGIGHKVENYPNPIKHYNFRTDFAYQFSPEENFTNLNGTENHDNPEFNKAMHSTPKNYFQLYLQIHPSIEKFSLVNSYLNQWFDIDPTRERIWVSNIMIDEKPVKNRFKVKYYNKYRKISKMYYFDIDFGDKKESQSPYLNENEVYIYNADQDQDYNNQYAYTLNKDCQAIQTQMYNPTEIKCTPMVNKAGYIVPQVYKAELMFLRGAKRVIKNKICIINITMENNNVQLFPDKPKHEKYIIQSISDMIKDRVEYLRTQVPLHVFSQILRTQSIKKRLKRIKDYFEMKKYNFTTKMKEIEKTYQQNLKNLLMNQSNNVEVKAHNFKKTYDIMLMKSDEINAFYIEQALRRTIIEQDFKHIYKVHKYKKNHYSKETQLILLVDQVDYIKYLADQHLDDNYHKFQN